MFKTNILRYFLIVFFVFLPFCDDENQKTVKPDDSGPWLIPVDQVVDGGPGRDGIPAISNPDFISISRVDFLVDNDLVIGLRIGNFIRAFPHRILDYHEIVNHQIDTTSFALTYCPLTGSGIIWDSTDFTGDRSFGVSGLLYNSNLIPYDRSTNSNWSQMLNLSVNGSLSGQEAIIIPSVETTWATWKELYPDSLILSTNTGFNRDYSVFPYGDYKTNSQLLFPVNNIDTRLAAKDRVHGIIVGDKTKVYQLQTFNGSIEVLNESFNNLDIVVVGSTIHNFAVSFERKLEDGTLLNFESVGGEFPAVMRDDEGNKWDIFGLAVSGPRKGETLTSTESFISYWFAWSVFYPDAEIHNHPLLSASDQPYLSAYQEERELNSEKKNGRQGGPAHASFIRKEFIRSRLGKRFLKEWTKINKETKLVPHLGEGKMEGLKILELPEVSLFSDLGIEKGDILKEVNGHKIKSPRTLSKLFKEMINENRFEIGIERNGEWIYLFYDLK